MSSALLQNHYKNLIESAMIPRIEQFTLIFSIPTRSIGYNRTEDYDTTLLVFDREISSIIVGWNSSNSGYGNSSKWQNFPYSINGTNNGTYKELNPGTYILASSGSSTTTSHILVVETKAFKFRQHSVTGSSHTASNNGMNINHIVWAVYK